jgi:hypothetical protein
MLMSDPLAATAHWIITVPTDVCSVANATGEALPAALVSLVIALAVAVPVLDAAKAVTLNGSVATAAPGAATLDGLMRKTKLPLTPISAVTASVAALRAAVLCVTAILDFLQLIFIQKPNQFIVFGFASFLASHLHRQAQLTNFSAKFSH